MAPVRFAALRSLPIAEPLAVEVHRGTYMPGTEFLTLGRTRGVCWALFPHGERIFSVPFFREGFLLVCISKANVILDRIFFFFAFMSHIIEHREFSFIQYITLRKQTLY
jgi:hypothetical protein